MPGPSFATLSAERCPAIDTCLLAIAREFGEVDVDAIDEWLDERARHLFGAAELTGPERAERFRCAVADLRPACGADDLLVDRAADSGHADPVLALAIACEAARRAGLQDVGMCSAPGRWALLDGQGDQPVVLVSHAEHGLRAWLGPATRVSVRCGHELAFWILGTLAERFWLEGRGREALQAAELRLLLPISRDLRARVHGETEELRRRLRPGG